MIENLLLNKVLEAVKTIFNHELDPSAISIQKTRPEFEGDLTLVVFPLTKYSKRSPEDTGMLIGEWLLQDFDMVSSFNVIKGFLNLVINDIFWRISFWRITLTLLMDTKPWKMASLL